MYKYVNHIREVKNGAMSQENNYHVVHFISDKSMSASHALLPFRMLDLTTRESEINSCQS